MEMWSRERNYGPGSSAGGGKCGPGREIMVLGQTPPRPSVVRGEKLWSLVKRWWREVWSRERNRGSGSSAAPPECGPGREIMVLGQALVAGSVVQGEKLWSWVKHWWREVWSRERNCGFGSSPASPECGPRREIMVFGQALVAGSVVQGEKLRVWVKPSPARVWSEERNYGLGSSADGGKYGPGSQTAARVPPGPAEAWSREQNCGLGSSPSPPKCGPGSKTAARVKPVPAVAWSREPNCGPGSSPALLECGPRREIMVLGQALVAGSMV